MPDDYKQFLLENNGGVLEDRNCTFFVKELNEEIPLSTLYGLSVDQPEAELRDWHDEYKDDLLSNCIIIGDDPGSGMIVLVNDAEHNGIYYWDHSWYFEQSNEENNIYKMADSFQAFIDGLKKP